MSPKLAFFTNPWSSGEIRGRQIAILMGGIVDPAKVGPDDIFIGIKVLPSDAMIKHCAKCFVDVVDCHGTIPFLKKHPEVGVIAISKVAKDYLDKVLGRESVLIPEHHCNFEQVTFRAGKRTRVGYCGTPEGLTCGPENAANALSSVGLDFYYKTEFSNRQEIVSFYRQIDIQIAFRTDQDGVVWPDLKNPLKLANAGSFGIPTVCYPEASYVSEFEDAFVPALLFKDLIDGCARLAHDDKEYDRYSQKAYNVSRAYHISRILPMYQELLDEYVRDLQAKRPSFDSEKQGIACAGIGGVSCISDEAGSGNDVPKSAGVSVP